MRYLMGFITLSLVFASSPSLAGFISESLDVLSASQGFETAFFNSVTKAGEKIFAVADEFESKKILHVREQHEDGSWKSFDTLTSSGLPWLSGTKDFLYLSFKDLSQEDQSCVIKRYNLKDQSSKLVYNPGLSPSVCNELGPIQSIPGLVVVGSSFVEEGIKKAQLLISQDEGESWTTLRNLPVAEYNSWISLAPIDKNTFLFVQNTQPTDSGYVMYKASISTGNIATLMKSYEDSQSRVRILRVRPFVNGASTEIFAAARKVKDGLVQGNDFLQILSFDSQLQVSSAVNIPMPSLTGARSGLNGIDFNSDGSKIAVSGGDRISLTAETFYSVREFDIASQKWTDVDVFADALSGGVVYDPKSDDIISCGDVNNSAMTAYERTIRRSQRN